VETERFHKGHLLYGLFQARQEIREERRAVLVEGYFDVIATVASGRSGTVAGMGTALTQEQARLLARYADEVVVAYDGDPAGETAFERALPILLAEGLGVLRARFGEGHDPDSLRLASGEAAVTAAIDAAEDAVVLQLRRAIPAPMASARLKATQAGAVASLLEPIRDPLMRHEYARRAAEMLGVPEKEFLSRLKELKGWRGVAEPAGPTAGGSGGGAGPRVVRSVEEQVLAGLLQAGAAEPAAGTAPLPPLAALPPATELPPPDVFFDPECRNIYRAICTLYAEGGAAAVDSRAVLAKVASEQATIDRMAQILLERPFDPAKFSLSESLDKLIRRWRQTRLRELQSEIVEAQRRGDQARLASLVEERTSVSQSLQGVRPGDRAGDRGPGDRGDPGERRGPG
jgi:DNA primase